MALGQKYQGIRSKQWPTKIPVRFLPLTSRFGPSFNLIERLEEGGIPQHIDRSYWKGFLSGSLGPQVMGALRFFNLITGTDNEPTPDLERLVEDKEHRKLVFAEMLKGVLCLCVQ